MYNKLTCLFGHHDYSDKLTEDKDGRPIRLCKICKKVGTWTWFDNTTGRIDYNTQGIAYHIKYHDGYELWRDNHGRWVDKKPKNWIYENV